MVITVRVVREDKHGYSINSDKEIACLLSEIGGAPTCIPLLDPNKKDTLAIDIKENYTEIVRKSL